MRRDGSGAEPHVDAGGEMSERRAVRSIETGCLQKRLSKSSAPSPPQRPWCVLDLRSEQPDTRRGELERRRTVQPPAASQEPLQRRARIRWDERGRLDLCRKRGTVSPRPASLRLIMDG